MDYPDSLKEIVKECAAANPSDIGKAVDSAFNRWRKCDEYEEWTESMIRGQLRNMIHGSRHTTNVQILRDLNSYGGPAKVGLGSGLVNRVAAMSVLDSYCIGGRSLGDIMGGELKAIASDQQEKAAGYSRNARLCLMLATLVPDDKRVRDAVTEAKVRKLITKTESKAA